MLIFQIEIDCVFRGIIEKMDKDNAPCVWKSSTRIYEVSFVLCSYVWMYLWLF
jgi:hypothetical protein